MKRTSGPWQWSDEFKDSQGRKTFSLIGKGGYGILSCDGTANSPQGLGDYGNVHLISAAPDLLEILYMHQVDHRAQSPHNEDLCDLCVRTKLAIAKAEGREK